MSEFENDMDKREVFKFDDVRVSRKKSTNGILGEAASCLGLKEDATPEAIHAALQSITWDSSDDEIAYKFVSVCLKSLQYQTNMF